MTIEPELMRTSPTSQRLGKGGWIVLFLTAGFFLFFFVICLGMSFLVQTLYLLVTGWTRYLARTLPELPLSVSGTLWFLFSLSLFTWGVHLGCRRLFQIRAASATNSAKTACETNWCLRWSLSLVAVVLVLTTSGICLIGIFHQMWWMTTGNDKLVRGGMLAARRSTSKIHLKQIGLAMHNYHENFHQFPIGGTFSATGLPQHGWVARLLPYMDQKELYQTIDFNQPWTAEANRKPFETRLYWMQNPGLNYDFIPDQKKATGYQPAQYAGNPRVLGANAGLKLDQIKDGATNTILAGEVMEGIRAWGDPLNVRDPARGIKQGPDTLGGPFESGTQILFVDGSVRSISENIDPAVLKALSTPNGGEPVGDF
ncbi:MAG: DUF1559 domain-containing protein [Planctomycetaceae bacterium]|nr:DUF1559 domain-containing protein [Planctomycetaceae bacterium]